MTPDQLRAAVRRVRCEVADRVEALPAEGWDAPSWCAGWRVRDVLGHLVSMAEASRTDIVWMVVRSGGRADRGVDRLAGATGGRPVPELASRLRAAAGSSWGSSATLALGDVLVHAADALADLGQEVDASPGEVLPILDAYRRSGRVIFHAAPARKRRLVATDADWTGGNGLEVRGRARDLMLLLANRRQALPRLDGPGAIGL